MKIYRQIEYNLSGSVATIALNRPHARNGLTLGMSNELTSALDDADRNEQARAVVLTGAGADFCAGADVMAGARFSSHNFMAAHDDDQHDPQPSEWREPAGRCCLRIFRMNKPVIAAVRGVAIGAGASLTLPCDYRLAATDARFGFVFSRRGVYPEGASAWFLPRLVGLGKSLDWMISGRIFNADEALGAGLVSRLYPGDELLGQAQELAREIADSTAPVSVAVIRRLLYWASSVQSPVDVQRTDSRLIASLMSHPDAFEGMMSFLERRSPCFPCRVDRDLPGFLPWLDNAP